MNECWYCHITDTPEEGTVEGIRFTVCQCGATTVEFPNLKVTWNSRGGLKAVLLPPVYTAIVTARDRRDCRRHMIGQMYEREER